MRAVVPVGDLMRQLVLALGAAMLVGGVSVLIRERWGPADRPKPNMKVVALNLAIGTVLAVWGLGSILAAS